ncbi:type III secretion protein [Proteus mirabilis]|uniref:type III secretion protein n=1 Tax=Proteus mirabilis TaxID=584 RepID=UPI00249F8C9A|nr:type III secretion protein [Proteus mirabilis]WGY28593.1 type III secretion protein [Proteus mirabilis]
MLRLLPDNLLKYTCEGVLIRAHYIRQLDNIHKTTLATKQAAKKMLHHFNHKLDKLRNKVANEAYAKGLQVLLADIIKFSIEYQEKFVQYEFQQREQLVATIGEFLDSPEIQVKLTQYLMSSVPLEQKVTLDIPTTLQRYFESELDNSNIKFNCHSNKTIAIHTGDQITFFDPAIFLNDLRTQFHRPFSETYQPIFEQNIKQLLLNFINTFEPSDDLSSKKTILNEDNNEN